MSKRSIVLLSVGMSLLLLLTVFIVKVADGTFHGIQHGPEITASPEATLKYPEPTISADSGAKVPDQPKPTVQSQPAPVAPRNPANIPAAPSLSSPVYPLVPVKQAPIPPALVPLPAPQQALPAPITVAPAPVLPPTVVKPVEGVLEPLKPVVRKLVPPLLNPITDPLLK